MNIKLFFDEGPMPDSIRQFIQTCIFQMAEKIGIKAENIKSVGIASNQTYGDAIEELLPGERYTNNTEDTGVGKTLSRFKDNSPEHIIVLNRLVFESILRGVELNNQNKEQPAEIQLGPY